MSAPVSGAAVLLAVAPGAPGDQERFRQTAARLGARLGGPPVLAAYVVPGGAAAALSLTDAVERTVAGGAEEVVVVPYVVEWKTGEWQDVPDTMQELARAHPAVRFRLAQPLGTAEALVDLAARSSAAAWALPAAGDPAPAPPAPAGAPREAPGLPAGGGAPAAGALPAHGAHVLACFGRVCQQYGGDAVHDALLAELAARGLDAGSAAPGAVKVTRTKCLAPCAGAALVCVYPGGDFYWNLRPELMPRFVDEVLVAGGSLAGHTFRPGDLPAAAGRP